VAAWYLYDGEGNRVALAESLSGGTPTTTTYLPGGVEEAHSDGSLTKYYTAGGLALGLNTAHDASGITFLGDDGLGSTQLALDSSGVAVASQLFGPYGGVRYANGTMPTAKGFTGQQSDAAVSGLDYYVARYYDPALGQFTSADDQQGPNRYGYVTGNPETLTDPTGKDWLDSIVQVALTVGTTTVQVAQAAAPAAVAVLDATTGIPSMIGDVQTLFDPNASTMDKILAGGDLLLNVAMDVSMVVGVGEGARAAYVGAKIAGHVAMDVAEHVGEDELAHVGEDVLEHAGEDAIEHGEGAACALSFAPGTLVATPGGERAIASLKVGDQVEAYDLSIGHAGTQTVEATYINHDTDLLDVTLRADVPATVNDAGTKSQSASHSTAIAPAATAQADKATKATASATSHATTSSNETIHTTASHPWLTTDHGWLLAGFLRVGETVRTLDGATATVMAIRVVPGAAPMWDLTVSQIHDFAVGTGEFVVHNANCGDLDTLTPGPYADKSIPARGPKSTYPKFTPDERAQIDAIGYDTGCHTCGTKNPGAQHFVPDHQPPDRLNPTGGPQQLYPHCLVCSRTQGGQLNAFLSTLKHFRI
jgi:RHS repeat-associated protein